MKFPLAILLVKLFTVILLIGSTFKLQAQSNFNNEYFDLLDIRYLDQEQELSIHDLVKHPELYSFQNTNKKIHFGSSSNSFWLKLNIKRKLSASSNFLLEVGYPTLDEIHFYETKNEDVLKTKTSGFFIPFSKRDNNFRNHVFSIQLPDTLKHTFYLRVQSIGNMKVPLKILPTEEYLQKDQWFTLELGLGIGLLLLISITSLISFIFIRNSSYLLYALYIFFVVVFIIARNGVGFLYLWPNNPQLNYYATRIGLFCWMAFASLFANYFLSVKSYNKTWSIFIKSEAACYFILLMAMLGGIDHALLPRIPLIGFVHSILMVITGIIMLRKTHQQALLYTIGMILFAIIGILHILSLYSYLPLFFSHLFILRLGWYLEVFFLTLAVVNNFRQVLFENNHLKQENEKANLRLLDTESTLNKVQKQVENKDRKLMTSNLELLQHFKELESIQTEITDDRAKEKIRKLIDTEAFKNVHWKDFKTVFEEVHPNFFAEIKNRFPELTTNELRHLAYVKLNLQIREISNLTGVSMQAVKIARNRLKKKIGLQESLVEFVSNF